MQRKEYESTTLGARIFSRRRTATSIIAAIGLHLIVTVSAYLVGRFALWATMFDANGIIVPTDSRLYQSWASSLVNILDHQGTTAWLTAPAQSHVKIYSLSFALFGPVVGFNILAAEPLNILYYLAILCLIFKLGREVFDRRVAISASVIVAVWPSFLLHTTQLLRDPLFITAMLALVLILSTWSTRVYSWRGGLVAGIAGAGTSVVLWVVRINISGMILAIVLLGFGALVVRQFSEKRLLIGNLLSAALLLLAAISISQIKEVQRTNGTFEKISAERQAPPVWLRLAQRRQGFIRDSSKSSGSNIDTDVEFTSLTDVIKYIPRAIEIGYLAPFPEMWFTAGEGTGLPGRLLAGVETLAMYVIELLAFIGIWKRWRYLPNWLLLSIATVGVTALSLVVVNLGALYRMRYIFWMLLVILGVSGAMQLNLHNIYKLRRKVQSRMTGQADHDH